MRISDWSSDVCSSDLKVFRQRHDFAAHASHLFDLLQILALVIGDEADRNAFRSCPRCAADPVDILLSDLRQFEIDDMGPARPVNPARCTVARDQQLDATLAERLQPPSALPPAPVALPRATPHTLPPHTPPPPPHHPPP